MRALNSAWAMWSVLVVALPGRSAADGEVTTPTRPREAQAVILVADAQAKARRQGRVIIGGLIWTCSGARCSASTKSSAVAAPVALCQELARAVGLMQRFTAGNRSLNGIELQQCNSAVPAESPPTQSPAPPAAPVPSAAARSYPVSIGTDGMTVTGIGSLTVMLPFTSKSMRTDGMTVTGTGALTVNLPFTPKRILTTGMTVTGTGSLR